MMPVLLAGTVVHSAAGGGASGHNMIVAQAGADCYSVGQRVAASKGGTLVQASAESRGGQTVCRVVVVIPGGSGQRPRRAEFVVPAD